MGKKQKYYVVWQGRKQGIFTSWDECRKQVHGLAGAQFKAFDTLAEAEQAIRLPYSSVISSNTSSTSHTSKPSILMIDVNGITTLRPGVENPPMLDALAVDAACSGNPGVMEYQGIYIPTRTRVFHYRAERGTNNIGEFLAIVHGLAYLKKHRLQQPIYSDSANAISWVRQKQCKSKLPPDTEVWDIIHRAENWLRTNEYTTPILKWDTDNWGEIPADFGRK